MRPSVGDVFTVPTGEREAVSGQVLDQAGPIYLVVLFPYLLSPDDSPRSSDFNLAGIVFDAKFRNGDWPIARNAARVPFLAPWFVSGNPGLAGLKLNNLDSSVVRATTPSQAIRHCHMHVSSPAALQWAAEAASGRRDWIDALDHFRKLAIEMQVRESIARDIGRR